MAPERFGIIAPHPPIMVPAVGGSQADATAATAAALRSLACALASYAPDTVVIISPHAPGFADAVVVEDSDVLAGSLAQFGDPRVRSFAGDPTLARALISALTEAGIAAEARTEYRRLDPGVLDHGCLVPLAFLDPEEHSRLVVVSFTGGSRSSYAKIGVAVARASSVTGRRVAFIASGDLSHRLTRDAPNGFSPQGAAFDALVAAVVESGELDGFARIDDALADSAGECGLRSFVALAGFMGEGRCASRLMSYEGPWGVGYLVGAFGQAVTLLDRPGVTACAGPNGSRTDAAHDADCATAAVPEASQSAVVALARHAIDSWVRLGMRIETAPLPQDTLPARAGAFVSLHRGGELRGCIGTISPTRRTLADEVVSNAIEAATRDPRFEPLAPDELDDLEISVDILGSPEPCQVSDLDPARYGVIVTAGYRRGLLLPDLEGVDDVETQVSIARRKAGIGSREACTYERFTVDRYT